MFSFFIVLAAAHLAAAHFHLNYPYWRGDSFSTNPGITQYQFPCAGIGQDASTNNRTLWPLSGGSLAFAGSHPHAYTYVNLGLGSNVTVFNISLVPAFNQTGNGSFCWERIALDAAAHGIADGAHASIQVIQIGEAGMALYNCADITFSSNASLLEGVLCANATGVGGVALVNAGSAGACAAGNASNASSSSNSTATGAASAVGGNGVAAGALVVAAAVAFAVLM